MSTDYYVVTNGQKEGPLDMLTIMRRVRAGKIKPDTEIFIGDSEFSKRADVIDEISPFFLRLLEGPKDARALPGKASLGALLRAGWSFTIEHNIMTVYAGGMLLMLLMLTLVISSQIGVYAGLFVSWCIFMVLHNMYFVFAMRFFRGQTFGDDFINLQLAPALATILLSSLLLAAIIAGGIALFIVPGVLAATFFIFVPILLLDTHCSIPQAFKKSYRMVKSAGAQHIITLNMLLALHLLCFALIIPVPLTLPIIIAALCEMYEKLST
ncbi:MAG: hypothetical protein ACK502_03885 [Alphaproteobacteria bacterium]